MSRSSIHILFLSLSNFLIVKNFVVSVAFEYESLSFLGTMMFLICVHQYDVMGEYILSGKNFSYFAALIVLDQIV